MGRKPPNKSLRFSQQREPRPLWRVLLGNVLLGKIKNPVQWSTGKGKPLCVSCGAPLKVGDLQDNVLAQSCIGCRQEVETEMSKRGLWIWRDVLRETVKTAPHGVERLELLTPLLELMDEDHAEAMFSIIVSRRKPLRTIVNTAMKTRAVK